MPFAQLLRALCVLAAFLPVDATAWGDMGHEIVATMAAKILETGSPKTLKRVEELLASDTANHLADLADLDIASQARRADAFRSCSQETDDLSAEWNFVDIDFINLGSPNEAAVCKRYQS